MPITSGAVWGGPLTEEEVPSPEDLARLDPNLI